jgi:ubiquinone/menaquinone biosynthesis C-methylase UbiE
MIINQDYKDQLAAMHSQGRFVRGSKILSTIKPFLKQYQPTSILDFGCGPGIMSVFFNNNYVGVDIDKTRIQYAQKMYPDKTFKQIGFLSNDEKNTVIPYPNNYFDIILLNDCVHHISNREMSDIISELFRVLQIGGYIIVREPNKNTNMLTYMVTEIAENGNYIRSKEEYKQLFSPLQLVHEK